MYLLDYFDRISFSIHQATPIFYPYCDSLATLTKKAYSQLVNSKSIGQLYNFAIFVVDPHILHTLPSAKLIVFLLINLYRHLIILIQYDMSSSQTISSYSQSYQEYTQSSYSKELVDKVASVQNNLSQYLQIEYHDVLISDINFVPANLIDQVNQLQETISNEQIKQIDLTQEINRLTFQLHSIDAEIQGYSQAQVENAKIPMQENVLKRKVQFKQTINLQQNCEEEEIRLAVQTQRLQKQIQEKMKSQQDVVKYLTKAIMSEKDAIKLEQKRIFDLKKQIFFQKTKSKVSTTVQRSKEFGKKMEEDRKIALRQNIAKLKQYIQMNEQYRRQ